MLILNILVSSINVQVLVQKKVNFEKISQN